MGEWISLMIALGPGFILFGFIWDECLPGVMNLAAKRWRSLE